MSGDRPVARFTRSAASVQVMTRPASNASSTCLVGAAIVTAGPPSVSTVSPHEVASPAVASPAGFEPATFRLEGGCSIH